MNNDYDEREWDALIEAAAEAGDEAEVERLMIAASEAFIVAFPHPVTE